jgi:hypothetical protein
MLRFAADECLDGRILRGLLRRLPELDIVRIQDTEIVGAEDPVVPQWAADTGRVIRTENAETMPRWAYERVNAGQPMLGVIEVGEMEIGPTIEDLVQLVMAGTPEDCDGRVIFLSL